MGKVRLDRLVHDRGLCESREKARALIMAGLVLVDGVRSDKPGTAVKESSEITLVQAMRYVSRGGYKLEKALDTFSLNVEGVTAMDVGASTGGFTDCLLQRGAARVYSVDVGRGQLAWSLRNDSRVVVLEGQNARYLNRSHTPLPIGFATMDLSFISALKVVPAVRELLSPGARLVLLVKPQFEAGKALVGKKGIVSDPAVHRGVLVDVCRGIVRLGFDLIGLTVSPIKGQKGNVEFLAAFSLTVLNSAEDLANEEQHRTDSETGERLIERVEECVNEASRIHS